MTRLRQVVVFAALATAATTRAAPYWIAWEGDDWPENQGWTRSWGNWEGQYQGPGAYRTLENGTLTYDSLYDPGVFDSVSIERPGQTDPGIGETFVAEWRLAVDDVVGTADPAVGIASDAGWLVGFGFSETAIISLFEDFVEIPIVPWVFHEYRLLSSDMLSYQLFIDGQLARTGLFWESYSYSGVGWGDGVQGAASLHSWDYFRYGVTPEPNTAFAGLVFLCGARRLV
jgi:hypothetical protein